MNLSLNLKRNLPLNLIIKLNVKISFPISNPMLSIIRQGVISMESDNDRRGHYYHLEEGDSYGLESFASLTNPRYATLV